MTCDITRVVGRKLFHVSLAFALAAAMLLGECADCRPAAPAGASHDCCDPALSQDGHCNRPDGSPRPCPDRNEILKVYKVSDSAPVIAPGPSFCWPDGDRAAGTGARDGSASACAPAPVPADSPPGLFLRNSVLLI